MGIATEILRLQSAKAGLETAIESKGVIVPVGTHFDGYSALVDDIELGVNITDGMVVKTRDADGYALTVDHYGTTVHKRQYYSLSPTYWGHFSKMTGITFKDSVTTIAELAFAYCLKLELTELPSTLTTLGSSAFIGCPLITFTTFPDSVTQVGSGSAVNSIFRNCTGLTTITAPKVTVWGWSTFAGCTNLQSFTSGSIGTPLTITLPINIFTNCTALTSITVYTNNGLDTDLGGEPWGCPATGNIYWRRASDGVLVTTTSYGGA